MAGLSLGGGLLGQGAWVPPALAQPPETATAIASIPPRPLGDASGAHTGTLDDVATAEGPMPQEIKDNIRSKAGHGFPMLANAVGQDRIAINILWTLLAGILVMFMQAGFALVETGFTRAKNASHTFLMNFTVYFIGMFGFWICGFALMMGNAGAIANLGGTPALNQGAAFGIPGIGTFFATKGFFLSGDFYDVSIYTLFLFQMVFMDTAATIPTGAMAERWKFTSFIVFGFFVSMFLYPIFGHWAWGGGWLSQVGKTMGLGCGYTDFAGSGVVHMIGGFCGLAGASALGPRIGKFNQDGSANAIPGHNVPMALLGGLILGFGWFGFNAGSMLGAAGGGNLRIGIVATSTMMASAASGLTSMAYMYLTTKRPDPTMVCNGFLAGLVAITASCAFVSAPVAVIIGGVAGVLVCLSVQFVDRLLIDDPVGAISVHATCGLWGVLCVGLFADGTFGAGWNGTLLPDGTARPLLGLFPAMMRGDVMLGLGQLGAQGLGALVAMVWSFGVSLAFFKILDAIMGIRSRPEDEIGGLDIPETGIMAYPTFPTEVEMELAALS